MTTLTTLQRIEHTTLISVELSQSATFDLIRTLQQCPHIRFESKKRLSELKKHYQALSRYMIHITGKDIHLLAQVADSAEDELKQDLNVLYYSIKNEIDRHHGQESQLIAHMVKASILVQTANGFIGAFRRQYEKENGRRTNKHGCHVPPLKGFDTLAKIESSISHLTDLICKAISQKQINLTQSDRIQLAVDVLQKKLMSAELLTKILNN